MELMMDKTHFNELLDDYNILIKEQNKIKYEFLTLYNLLLDMEFVKHKKIVKDDNETYVRNYEFQRNLKLSLYLDIEEDNNKYYMTKKLDDICVFTNGNKIEDNYINVFDKLRKQSNNSNNDNIPSEYPIHGTNKKIDNYNRERFNIIINKNKPDIDITTTKLYLDDNYISIHLKEDNNLLHQYIGYYLYKHIDDIYFHIKGSNIRQYDLNELKSFKINIPLNENHIMKTVKDAELFYNEIININKEIYENKNRFNFWSNIDFSIIGSNETIKLKNELHKIIEDNKLNRKNLKKFKVIVYNELLQEPLNEPSFN
jgi:hypothetical protein